MVKNIIIVGAFHEVIELVEESGIKIFGLVDNVKHGNYRKYPILLNDSDGSILSQQYVNFPILITPDMPTVRFRLSQLYSEAGFSFFQAISSKAQVSVTAEIDTGSIIQYGVNLSSEVKIGKFVKLNTLCNIMHNVHIDDYSTIAPNAVILGNVKIGKQCYIGANSTILPNINICDDTIVGAGALVTKDISTPGTYIGAPAKLLNHSKSIIQPDEK